MTGVKQTPLTDKLRLALWIARRRRGLTQQQLAERMRARGYGRGWDHALIARIEGRGGVRSISFEEALDLVAALQEPLTAEELGL